MRWAIPLLVIVTTGCAYQKRAQNPLPGVFRVAVLPFNDKTGGAPGLDTVEMTRTFAVELQKVPTFEVVPVEEVRQLLGPNVSVPTNQPAMAYAIARAVHAQAVIVGDITDYEAYYPPSVGLHCEMYAMITGQPEAVVRTYSPEPTTPAVAIGGLLHHAHEKVKKRTKKTKCRSCPPPNCCDPCQSGELPLPGRHGSGQPVRIGVGPTPCGADDGCCESCEIEIGQANSEGAVRQVSHVTPTGSAQVSVAAAGIRGKQQALAQRADPQEVDLVSAKPGAAPALRLGQAEEELADEPIEPESPTRTVMAAAESIRVTGTAAEVRDGRIPGYEVSVARLADPTPVVEPWVIRHSRIFDGTNGGLVQKLKGYHFFREDLRAGGWPGYELRMHDYNHFVCNTMIYEMLAAAGGQWTTLFGVRIPKPWKPWPWR